MIEFKVEGMTCGHCVATVKKAATAAAPGGDVAVDLPSKTVRVSGAPDEEAVKAAVREAGYQVV
jgi:copper chaperone